MTVCINGSKREVPEGITLEVLMELFRINKKTVVLELNRQVVDRNSLPATRLSENDALEIVHFVGGG
ncbi:MAG: sulfur carrier protein ThiS [Candidatus Omnitrophica bacterium]|nr:sulfur carrier protein ThiS [Candidatus Omnitrophota bacterium]